MFRGPGGALSLLVMQTEEVERWSPAAGLALLARQSKPRSNLAIVAGASLTAGHSRSRSSGFFRCDSHPEGTCGMPWPT